MISPIGQGLNILISCNYSLEHNWMSYLCWYSIKKTLSDAKVYIYSKRENITGCLFLWTKKVNVPFKTYSGDLKKESFLIVPPHVMAIRDFEEANIDPNFTQGYLEDTNFLKDAKSNDFCVFSSYLNGWGNFVTSEWINNTTCPLLVFRKFPTKNMSMNEKRIEKLWDNSIPLFRNISGG